MIVTIVGIGLIGGSMAINLKENGFASKIIGVDKSRANLNKAIRRRLIDEDCELNEAIDQSDLIILAIPMDKLVTLLPKVLNRVTNQTVMDVGSTKSKLMETIIDHPKRKHFVGTHPMAGTEFSGPEAAIPDLFEGKCAVLCDIQKSDEEAVKVVERLYKALNMNLVYQDASAHDIHCAYVSHISHISSFALALTVLEKEKDENKIFELAGGGFSSTVRLAKSSPEMWVPIFQQNRDNILDVLDEHINTLAGFRSLLIKEDFKKFYELIQKANSIKKILH